MRERIELLVSQRATFAFETTLASRTFAPWITAIMQAGFGVHLVFLTLPSPDMAVQRVRYRVSLGGHSVPEPTIRRRFHRGLKNLFQLYMPVVSTWRIYGNHSIENFEIIARGGSGAQVRVFDALQWSALMAITQSATESES